jgi:hypothetical protein
MTFLLQVFDIYVDCRQMRKYSIPNFPLNFLAAFNLYELIESKLKKASDSETASNQVDDARPENVPPQDSEEMKQGELS